MICGDVDGNIAWHASALTPRRVGGWDGRCPYPGTGEYDLERLRDDLPFEFNPERGYIATANHNIHPPGYSPPLFFKQRALQPVRSREPVARPAASGLRPEDFERFQHDTLWPYIEAEKALLRGWTSDVPDVEWARQAILEWDGRYSADRVEPSLHNHWRRNLDAHRAAPPDSLAGAGSARRLCASRPRTRPRAPRRGANGAGEAVEALRKTLGPTGQVAMGTAESQRVSSPAAEASDLPGVERNGGGETVAAIGATYRHVIDFADLDNSRATNTPGQSGQPGSPFYGNLREHWAKGQYFPLRYGRPSVERLPRTGSPSFPRSDPSNSRRAPRNSSRQGSTSSLERRAPSV